MAEYYSSPDEGDVAYDDDTEITSAVPANRLTKMTNVAGAVVSFALILGIGVWGYKLLVRDVSGVPVVRAAQGDMRVRPEEPGGQLAQHQGLSVNAVAAEGTAGKFADELRLAPLAVDLTDEDQVVPIAMVAPLPQAGTAAADEMQAENADQIDLAGALQSGNVEDLVAQLTDGVEPLEESDTNTLMLDDEPEVVAERVSAVVAGPGMRVSKRPRFRPENLETVTPASAPAASADAATAAAPADTTKELDVNDLPVGTRLAQLGAFDSPEVARDQWVKMNARFGAYLQGKQRVVQKATSGGRVFYRLRAHGFDDIADARQFCAALVAENADCIPVVTR